MTQKTSGFTLIEILIAFTILAIIGSITITTLNSVLRNNVILKQHHQQLLELQTAMTIMTRDFQQTLDRPITVATDQAIPALLLNSYPTVYVEFTHGGSLSNKMSLERVAYFVQNGDLIRQHWLTLDRDIDALPEQHILLRNIQRFHVEAMTDANKFLSAWPHFKDPAPIPKAIRMKICLLQQGCLTRFIALNGKQWDDAKT